MGFAIVFTTPDISCPSRNTAPCHTPHIRLRPSNVIEHSVFPESGEELFVPVFHAHEARANVLVVPHLLEPCDSGPENVARGCPCKPLHVRLYRPAISDNAHKPNGTAPRLIGVTVVLYQEQRIPLPQVRRNRLQEQRLIQPLRKFKRAALVRRPKNPKVLFFKLPDKRSVLSEQPVAVSFQDRCCLPGSRRLILHTHQVAPPCLCRQRRRIDAICDE